MSLMRVKSDNWRNIAVNDFSGWHKVKLLCLCPSFEFKFNKLRSQLNLLFKMCQAEQEILAIIRQIYLCKFKWRDFMTELKALPYYQYQVTTHSCPPVWLCHAGEPPKYPVIRANQVTHATRLQSLCLYGRTLTVLTFTKRDQNRGSGSH